MTALNRALTLGPDPHAAADFKRWVYFEWGGELDTLWSVLDRLPPDAELVANGTARMTRVAVLLL